MITAFLGAHVELASPVQAALTQASQPDFSAYAGGQLQADFIAQWTALQLGVTAVATVVKTVATLEQAIAVASAQLSVDAANYNNLCNSGNGLLQAISDVVLPAIATLGAAVATVATAGAAAPALASAAGGLVSGINQYEAYQVQCQAAANLLGPDDQKLALSELEAFSGLQSAVSSLVQYAGQIASSGAVILSDENKAQLANASAQLEAQLAAQTQTTSFGLYRLYHEYDTWEAAAEIQNARVFALTARRAIEAGYVVDLSQLTKQEAYVASPAVWANTIYTYDLSLPAALGLTIGDSGSNPAPGGIYQDQVANYVTNLQGFVSGFAVTRPSAVDESELDVVSLPGLQFASPVTTCATVTATSGSCEGNGQFACAGVAGTSLGTCTDNTGSGGGYSATCCETTYPAVANWTLHCPVGGSGGTWVPVPMQANGAVVDADSACANLGGSHPDEAQLSFSLDPWGRLNGATTNPPYTERYNTRWTQMALNFVGTGVKNCILAADPNACYQAEYIPYNVTQAGATWISDYNGLWHQMDTPTGQIEGAKGLAAEIWLDPLQDGWGTQYIAPIARTELELRPTGGAYLVDVPVAPEVVLANIQRVQILVGTQAWVAQ
jgi:hypothetical protein